MFAMKKLKSHVSKEDVGLTILSSVNGLGHNSGSVPTDLLLSILSRLPAKSTVRFRCVSKDWAYLLRCPDFTDMFLKMSSARPRLLLTFQAEGKWSFFSAPQSLVSDDQNSLVVVENHMHCIPRDYSFGVCLPVRGMLCTKDEWVISGRKDARMIVCNPSTGISLVLPKVRSRRGQVITFFGYDPVEKQSKVLCMTMCERPSTYKAEEHQVLTLGAGKLKWRMIECSVSYFPNHNGICINGVIYYLAHVPWTWKTAMIVCFDVRSEKFNFVTNEALKDLGYQTTLINYKGKLGAIHPDNDLRGDEAFTSFELWVMDNIEEHQWSRHVHILPPLWKELVGDTKVYIVGMIGTTEVVVSPSVLDNPFYIFHIDMVKNTVKRVEIQGIGPLNGQKVHIFLNHVENVKSIV